MHRPALLALSSCPVMHSRQRKSTWARLTTSQVQWSTLSGGLPLPYDSMYGALWQAMIPGHMLLRQGDSYSHVDRKRVAAEVAT